MSRERRDHSQSKPLELGRNRYRRSSNSKRRSLTEISVKDTIGDVPGLWLEDYKVRPSVLDALGLSKLPDMDEVMGDVRDISKELRKLETGRDPTVDMDDIKKDVAEIVGNLVRAEKDRAKGGDHYSGEDIFSVSKNVRKMVRRIEMIETRRERAAARKPLPDMKDLQSDILDIQSVKESPIRIEPRKPMPSPRIERPALPPSRMAEPVTEPASRRDGHDIKLMIRRSVPLLFLLGAFMAYAMVFGRVVFSIPLAGLFPVSIQPRTVMLILLGLLVVTTIMNFFRRMKIRKAMRSENPIWHGTGGGPK